jgi:hypothetical protein
VDFEAETQRLTLSTLSNQNLARAIRDKLIRNDRMEIALEVTRKCNIESEPVWAQWAWLVFRFSFFGFFFFFFCFVVFSLA